MSLPSPPDYNLIAPAYGFLSRLVFGNLLLQAQQAHLHFIPPGATVLIVGGGNGQLIASLASTHQGLHLVHLDASPKMTSIARKRNPGKNKLDCVCALIEHYQPENQVDVLLTPFFFDNFTEPQAQVIFRHCSGLLRPGGLWLHTDFRDTGKPGHRLLLRLMYAFFRVSAGVKARELPPVAQFFQEGKYLLQAETTYRDGLLYTSCYRKS